MSWELFALATVAVVTTGNPEGPKVAADLCVDTTSNAEYTDCWQQLAEQARADVDNAYERAHEVAETSDLQESYGGAPRDWLTEPLGKSQTSWVKYLYEECSSQGSIARGGSGTNTLVAKCQFRLSRTRAHELKAFISLVESLS